VVGLDQPQTPFEVAGLDRPDKGVDHQPRGAGGITRPAPGQPPAPVPHPCSLCFIRSRSGIANSAAIVATSPGVIMRPASAEVTAFIAATMSWAFSPRARPVGALSIGGETNLTMRSRQGGRMRGSRPGG
jgi:hypothetical protein